MPLAKSNKTPPARLAMDKDIRLEKYPDIVAESAGAITITGRVPATKPSITKAPRSASPVIAAAARADDSVMHGKNTVITPSPNSRTGSLKFRLMNRASRDAKRPSVAGIQTTSRPAIKKHPCNASIIAKTTASVTPNAGRTSFTASAALPTTAPMTAPANAYDKTRPELYSTTERHSLGLPGTSRAQTNGPHMAAQCHDIKKLNHAIDTMVATSKASIVWSRCSIWPC